MARRPDVAADRLVYFSDAVVAIAVTLLVLPLVDLVPEVAARHETVRDLLAQNTGPILAFLLSFVVIARLWSSHHQLFDGVLRVGPPVVALDMLWLLTIVVLPFPTALTGSTSSDPLTALLYVGVLAVNLLAMTGLAVLVHRERDEGDEDHSVAVATGVGTSAAMVVLGFVVLLIAPGVGFFALLLLFLGPLAERLFLAVTGAGRRRSEPG